MGGNILSADAKSSNISTRYRLQALSKRQPDAFELPARLVPVAQFKSALHVHSLNVNL